LYFFSPVDVMPEAILGPLGLPDDIIAALIAGRLVYSGYKNRSLAS